ncbi:MAG: hypothetical protein FJ039_10720 [Chloroflexi bacterium]|nr:hypothetical protein [Chloroflexota bacterium]
MENIGYRKEGHIVTITLNRPEKLNALDPAMARALAQAWIDFQGDGDARAAILTGVGRGFCAGIDMRNRLERAEAGLPGTAVSAHDLPDLYLKFHQWGLPGVKKPVITAVNGLASGIGFHLVLMSDLRIAVESATFSLPEVKVSIMGGSHRLALQGIPLAVMQQLVLTGEPITAKRAYEVGLLNKVVPPDALMDEAMALAKHIAKQPPLSVSYNKLATWKAVALADQMADYLVLQWTAELMKTDDHKEALNAFLEKREPDYKGR